MSHYNQQPSLTEVIKDIKARLKALSNSQAIPIYTVATRPVLTATTPPTIIFVYDGSSGQRFQGWDPTAVAWVPLG